jgi:YesN/AraC family two-component response regulator
MSSRVVNSTINERILLMKYKLLLAEDEQIERLAMKKMINMQYQDIYEIFEAENGIEAVDIALKEQPDMIFMDIKMPGMTGLEAAAKIRESNKSVKIIFVTAFDTFEYAKGAISVKAEEMLLKPVDMDEFISQMNDWTEQLEQESFNELLVQLQEKNDMKLKIAQDELEQIRMQELLKEAKLQGLQMQITPHFLFNTLNVISKMAFLENDDKVYHLIIALSKFLRHSLKNRQSCVPIQEEVDMIGQYLYILQARMGNRLHYNIDNQLEKDTTQELPLFTLQPIVENAFKHGVEPCLELINI